MAKWLVAILLVVALVSPVTADPLHLNYAVSGGGQLADWVTSVRFSGGGRCTEANRFYRGVDGSFQAKKAAISKAGLVTAVWLFQWSTRHTSSPIVRVLAHGLAYGSGGTGAYNAGRNIAHCGW